MRTLKFSVLLIVISFFLTGCTKVLMSMYGMKSSKTLEEKEILKYCNKYNIDKESCFEMDSSYFTFLLSLDTSKYRSKIKNHYQPLQALYYDRNGVLQSFQVNCYAGGFPNLNWERDSIFHTFIPKIQAPLDSILPLEEHLKFLNPLSVSDTFSKNDYDYVIIVHWSRFMGRQSKRLIKLVQQNAESADDKNVRIIYVNNDNLFARK